MADPIEARSVPSLSLTTTPMLPPPAHSSLPSSTSSSSLGKRKRGDRCYDPRPSSLRRASSNVSSAFSASTKEQVKNLDNGEVCWHCSATPTDICHVITKADREVSSCSSYILQVRCTDDPPVAV
jgi:hypothetical protein